MMQGSDGAAALLEDPAFGEALARVLATAPELAPPYEDAGEALTKEELALLREGGLSVDGHPPLDALAASALAFSRLLATSLSTSGVAAQLGVDGARIRQRLAERSLYGIKTESGEWRLPAFQFDQRGLVANIGSVLRALPDDLHPLEVEAWLTAPDPDLEIHGRVLSPLDWLRTGGRPEPLVQIAEHVAEPV